MYSQSSTEARPVFGCLSWDNLEEVGTFLQYPRKSTKPIKVATSGSGVKKESRNYTRIKHLFHVVFIRVALKLLLNYLHPQIFVNLHSNFQGLRSHPHRWSPRNIPYTTTAFLKGVDAGANWPSKWRAPFRPSQSGRLASYRSKAFRRIQYRYQYSRNSKTWGTQGGRARRSVDQGPWGSIAEQTLFNLIIFSTLGTSKLYA